MKEKNQKAFPAFFWLGALAVLGMLVPFLALGEDAVVVYHDQLDGEMIAYILRSRHLWETLKGTAAEGLVLPEFMGGMSGTALIPPAPMCVLLFCLGHYFAAYVIMQLLGSLTGYVGMYLLGKEVTGRPWIGMLVGILYGYLPFLPVYGLSQYGIPLLIWCFYRLWKGQSTVPCVLYGVLYALNSSLVLVGFAVLGIWLAAVIIGAAGRRNKKGEGAQSKPGQSKGCGRTLAAWAAMLLVYILENASLLGQMLFAGGGAELSHKAEYVLTADAFWSSWFTAFVKGGQHSEDYHIFILAGALVLLLICVCCKAAGSWSSTMIRSSALTLGMGWILGLNLLLSLAAALWNSSIGVAFRSHMQALRGFQLDRVLWVSPAFWYLLLACILGIAAELAHELAGRKGFAVMIRAAAGVTAAACLCLTGVIVLKESCLKPNLQKMLHPDYQAISYKDYYAEAVMQQVKEYIRQETGQEPSEYGVVSLGIDPAAAYYAGFYCLDGYSNNYSLEYKHAFRRILEPELIKSEYLTQYFDDWGNRCYLLSAECPGYYTIEKGGFFFQNYELNAQALWEMGGRYLLAAAYIQNGEEQGLTLIREEPFETQDSYYRIFLYAIEPDSLISVQAETLQ